MKKICLLTFMSFWCILGAYAQNGNITGVVIDDQKFVLPGAVVSIDSLNKATVTDVDGKYYLADIRPGTHTIRVRFVGCEMIERLVTVAQGTMTLDFTMTSGIALDEAQITGRIGNDLRALNQQQNSPRIVNIIPSEQIGSFPDPNIGDALKRIPGIYVQYD